MTEQEAQQTQTIARIKDEYEKHFGRTYHAFSDFAPLVTELYGNLGMLLEIVDSQAQKIADQAQTIEINAAYAIELQGKIAEQAKELKLLRYVLEAEKIARIYEDGTGAAGEALFHARKELEEYDSKTDSKEVVR